MRVQTHWRVGLIIFVVAWVVRLALVLHGASYRQPVNPVETVLVAQSLAAGEGFSNPYGCPTGPTAHLAPVYPFILSLIYRAFPPGSSRELTVYLLSAIFVALAYALLPWLARCLRLDTRVGMFAGFTGALLPLFFWVEVTSEWEAGLSAMLLVIGLGVYARWFESPAIRSSLAVGALWGVILVTAPTFLFVFVALSIAFFIHWRSNPGPTLRAVAKLWVPVVLILAPWTIRNLTTFHEFILTRGNAGLQLHMSFNPQARATFDEGAVSGAFKDHPHTTTEACLEFARFGEVVMNQRYQQEAISWIEANPARSMQLVLGHFVAYWRMPVPSGVKTLASELITLCGLIGLGLCLKLRLLAGYVLGLVFLIFPLVYYINFFDVRYRYPLHPLMLLLGCLFLNEAAQKLKKANA